MTTAPPVPGTGSGPGGVGPDDAAEHRAAIRAFVRAHHPDVGGDPEVFRAGLARLREAAGDAADDAVWSPRPGGPDPDDPRLHAPVVAVRHVTLHRLGRFGRRLARRYDPRPGSARVR
jgi:hypothetical protein